VPTAAKTAMAHRITTVRKDGGQSCRSTPTSPHSAGRPSSSRLTGDWERLWAYQTVSRISAVSADPF
jgi:hypothetical protein